MQVPKAPPKVSTSVQQDQDPKPRRMDVIIDPTSASPMTTLQANTTFRQDRVYLLSPFEFGRCRIPSFLGDKLRGPEPL